jgi:mannitol-1-phosphate 5-dehydrogenase
VVCENLLDAPERLKGYIAKNTHAPCLERRVGLVPAIVSRMVPDPPSRYRAVDPLMIVTEDYNSLPVDRLTIVGKAPDIKGLLPIDNFGAYVERKLFIHNAGHSLASYLGYEAGCVYVWEAIRDKSILRTLLGAFDEVSEALIRKHGLDRRELEDHISDLLRRFGNRALEDSVARGARSPLRKLSFDDRLIGAARLAIEYGVVPTNLVLGIAAALRYDCEEDPEAVQLAEMLETEGIDAVLSDVCGLSPADRLYSLIKEQVLEKQEKGAVG